MLSQAAIQKSNSISLIELAVARKIVAKNFERWTRECAAEIQRRRGGSSQRRARQRLIRSSPGL
jgi:hypothetical protein